MFSERRIHRIEGLYAGKQEIRMWLSNCFLSREGNIKEKKGLKPWNIKFVPKDMAISRLVISITHQIKPVLF